MTIFISKRQLCALALISAASAPAFAANIEAKVTGTIIPSACFPSISGGGVFHFGKIHASSLSSTDYTALERKILSFNITCDSPAKVVIDFLNGRPGTLAGSTESGPDNVGSSPVTLFDWPGMPVTGLGLTTNGAKIGGYGIVLSHQKADGKDTFYTLSRDRGVTWSRSVGPGGFANAYNITVNELMGWNKIGSSTAGPAAIKVLAADLLLEAYINKASELDLIQPVYLDGLTTIELVYL